MAAEGDSEYGAVTEILERPNDSGIRARYLEYSQRRAYADDDRFEAVLVLELQHRLDRRAALRSHRAVCHRNIGRLELAQILAGYDTSLTPANADAQIGPVTVGGDWIASSITAGVVAGGGWRGL